MYGTDASPLVFKLLGKSGRVKLLSALAKIPGRKFTLNGLSREAKVPLMTTQRAVMEFRDLGIVEVERAGKTFAVYLNVNSSLYDAIKRLHIKDPHREAAKTFADNISKTTGVVTCYLFGSTTAAKHKADSDADVAVIYDKTQTTAKKIENEAITIVDKIGDATHITVIPLFFSLEELNTPNMQNKKLIQNILEGELLWKRKKH